MSTAFAFAYCISMMLFIVLMRVPDMLGAKTPPPRRRSRRPSGRERRAAARAPPTSSSARPCRRLPVGVRTYEIEQPMSIGNALERRCARIPASAVERVLREGKVLEPSDNLVLEAARHGRRSTGASRALVAAGRTSGPRSTTASPATSAPRRSTSSFTVAQSRSERSATGAGRRPRPLLNAMFRGGEAIPFGPETVVARRRPARHREAGGASSCSRRSRQVIRPSFATDIVTLALGLALGALVGVITIPLGGVRITLGAAVGLLLVGIALSTLRHVHTRRSADPTRSPRVS